MRPIESSIALRDNRPRSIYQYSKMVPRLSSQISIFSDAFFVSRSLGIERQKKRIKFTIWTRKNRSHVRILIYGAWPILLEPAIPCLL